MTYKMMTYNIRYDTPDDQDYGWARRHTQVMALLKSVNADFFGVQEVLKQQLATLKQLPGYDWVGVARDDGQTEGEYNGIFYKRDKFELVDHGHFWLAKNPAVPELYPGAGCKRVCVYVQLKDRQTGAEFVATVTHLDNASAEARQFGAELILQRLADKIATQPFFLMGDFNVEMDDPTYHYVAEKLLDARTHSQTPPTGPNGSWQMDGTFIPEDVTAYSLIDFIFTNQFVTIDSYNIDDRTFDAGFYPSDHFPVELTVDLK
ncbi:endonuclease/exonuclease/phosphatase family protein [Lapidilactobacillus wuchangensis]|uniref:endonuclease/exonuclease/phosphatase family protein n=1 Tax=Lapidilactobacillus wuchangensis TaxID=2486001 RepID=UPI0013DE1A7D|nr:endonuclease/exonuclease/phosphatase family protein [Lapidilactobacillus wuchangensis]